LLALDDGGIRGLSELVILKEIMHRIKHLNNLPSVPRPCDYFDLIGGTGTGGLIALMLGRLEMPIDVAIDRYVRFAKDVFSKKKTRRNELFKATRFEKAMKTMIESARQPEDVPILGQESSHCRSSQYVSTSPFQVL